MRKIPAALLLCLLTCSALAATVEERLAALERDAGNSALSRVSVSGLIEVEASYERQDLGGADAEAASDLALATAQLAFTAAVTDQIGAILSLLWEEADDAVIEIDEALVEYQRDGWRLRLGRQYVPFGAYPSHFVTNPLTLDLGETREVAALLAYEQDRFSTSMFVFNGDARRYPNGGHINDYGAALRVTPVDGLEFGASFLSDLADSDAGLVENGNYAKRVPALSGYTLATLGPIAFLAECVAAAAAFDAADVDADGDGDGDRPLAWNVELAWGVLETVELALRLEGSRQWADAPAVQYGAALLWQPSESVTLALEYLRGEFDQQFGGGIDFRDRVTTQVALAF